jgi:hypothetical protein
MALIADSLFGNLAIRGFGFPARGSAVTVPPTT